MSEKCRHLPAELVVTDHAMTRALAQIRERSKDCKNNRHDLRHCEKTGQAQCKWCNLHMDWPPIVRPDSYVVCPVHEGAGKWSAE